jgi:pyruvate formate lyase activating enzyme
MNIVGVQKTTLLDFPGKIAMTIFTLGCNMRCPYCHNKQIAFDFV